MGTQEQLGLPNMTGYGDTGTAGSAQHDWVWGHRNSRVCLTWLGTGTEVQQGLPNIVGYGDTGTAGSD